MKSRFAKWAEAWDAAGRPAELLVSDDWDVTTMWLWTYTDGAKAEGVGDALAAFVKASKEAKDANEPYWYDHFLGQKDSCAGCGETFRVENLHICSVCKATYCTWDRPTSQAPNGNLMHHCGGEMVG